MASKKQFENRVKVITVAAVGKEFRKSKIIERILKAAKNKGHVATGQLTNPSKSRSITPFSDDRWLIRKDAVKVTAVQIPSKQFIVKNLTVRVRYGLNGKYQNLSSAFTNKTRWRPPVAAIAKWIRAKKGRGEFTNVADKDVRRVAFAIAKKIESSGIKSTSFANSFFNKTNGVRKTLDKGINRAAFRLDELYATSIEISIAKNVTTIMSKVRQLSSDLSKSSAEVIKLTQRLDNLKKGTKEYADTVERLNKAEERRRNTQKQLNQSTNGLIKGNKNHKKALKDVADATKKSDKASKAFSKSQTQQKGIMGRLTATFGKRIVTLGKYLLATKVISAATSALSEIFINSSKRAIEFESALANLAAVAGASKETVSQFADEALRVANETKFTTTEIVALQTEMTKLGFSQGEVLDSTRGIAVAAQALGAPLASVAASVGKVINQFGLLSSDTEYVTDVMVTTFNNSALSFETFGTAIQYVGPLAKEVGLDLQQVAGAMGVLADNGFAASKIGTGLRNIFIEIGSKGGSLEGKLRDLADQNLSLAEATDLVGKRSAAQLITLLDNIEAIEESNDLYYSFGRTQAAAAEQMNTTQGRLDILGNVWSNFTRTIGESITQSGFFIRSTKFLIELFDEEAKAAVEANEIIAKVGAERINDLNKRLEEAETAADREKIIYEQMAEALDTTFENVQKNIEYYKSETYLNYFAALNEQFREFKKTQDELSAGQQGEAAVDRLFGGPVSDLERRFKAGADIEKQSVRLSREIAKRRKQVKDRLDEIGEFQKGETDAITERRIRYAKAVAALEALDNRLSNLRASNAKAEKNREKQRIKDIEEALYAEIVVIRQRRDEIVEQAKLEKELAIAQAETEEEKTAAQTKFALAVSDANYEASLSVRALTGEYREVIKKVLSYVGEFEKLSEIDLGNIFLEGDESVDNALEAIDKLDKKLKDGKITRAEYDESLTEIKNGTLFFIDFILENVPLAAAQIEELNKAKKKLLNAGDGGAADLGLDPDDWKKVLKSAAKAVRDTYRAFAEERLDNFKNQQEQELDAIKNRYEIEEQILKSSLDNQLITESQFRIKKQELRRAQIAEENAISKKIFEEQKKQDQYNAGINTAAAIAEIYINSLKGGKLTDIAKANLLAGIAATQGVAQIAAISQRKFFPKKFEDGGYGRRS